MKSISESDTASDDAQTNHDTLWKVCLRDDDSAHVLQDLHEHCVFLGRGEAPAHISQGRVNAFDIELVFQRDRDSMQGTLELSGFCKLDV